MKYKLKQLTLFAISVVAVPVMLVSPALAVSGDDSRPTTTPTSTPKPSATPTPTNRRSELVKEVKSLSESEVKSRVDSINAKAEQTVKELEAKKEAAKTRTEQERKKACEARSDELTTRLNNKIKNAEDHKAVFDKIFARVTTFHDSKGLMTANYDDLLAKATAAQQAASDSIATLKSFNTTVDCTNVGAAATKLAAFKDALTQTKDSLKAYRTAIKNLTVAIKASIPEPSTTPKASPTATPTPEATPTNSGAGN